MTMLALPRTKFLVASTERKRRGGAAKTFLEARTKSDRKQKHTSNLLRLAHNSHTVNAIAIAIARATSAPSLHCSIAIDSVARRGRSRLFNLMAAGCHSSLTNIDIFCYVIRRPKVCNRKPLQKKKTRKTTHKKRNVRPKTGYGKGTQ